MSIFANINIGRSGGGGVSDKLAQLKAIYDNEKYRNGLQLLLLAKAYIGGLEKRQGQLEAALRALVGLDDGDYFMPVNDAQSLPYGYECIYCGRHWLSGDFIHAPDCPIVAGRKALKGGE